MRLLLISLLSIFIITISFGEGLESDETLDSHSENERTISPIKERSPAHTNSRNSSFVSYKIDSSKNGYGAFLETNSPLAYSYDANGDGENAGWVAVYRQFGTIDETAGLSAGAGLKVRLGKIVALVDYAFVDYDLLKSTHQVSLGIEF